MLVGKEFNVLFMHSKLKLSATRKLQSLLDTSLLEFFKIFLLNVYAELLLFKNAISFLLDITKS
jgi:hypothetical protein